MAGYSRSDGGALTWLPFAAFVILSDGKDINNLANPGGIAIQHNFSNRVSGVYGSGTGVAFACLQNGGGGCTYDGINAGSGISTGVAYVISGTVRNYFGVNRSNPGADVVYQTPTDHSLTTLTSHTVHWCPTLVQSIRATCTWMAAIPQIPQQSTSTR